MVIQCSNFINWLKRNLKSCVELFQYKRCNFSKQKGGTILMQSSKRSLEVFILVFLLLIMTNTALAKDVWFYTDKAAYGIDHYYLISESIETQGHNAWGCKVKHIHNERLIATNLYIFFQDSEKGGISVSQWLDGQYSYIGPVTSSTYYVRLWKSMQPYINR